MPQLRKICLQQPWLRGLDKNPKPKRGCKDPFSPQHRQVTPLSFQQCKVKIYIYTYVYIPANQKKPPISLTESLKFLPFFVRFFPPLLAPKIPPNKKIQQLNNSRRA